MADKDGVRRLFKNIAKAIKDNENEIEGGIGFFFTDKEILVASHITSLHAFQLMRATITKLIQQHGPEEAFEALNFCFKTSFFESAFFNGAPAIPAEIFSSICEMIINGAKPMFITPDMIKDVIKRMKTDKKERDKINEEMKKLFDPNSLPDFLKG